MPPIRKENCHRVCESAYLSFKKKKKKWGEKLKHQIFQISTSHHGCISHFPAKAPLLFSIFTIDINHNEVFQCLISSLYMHRHYLGLFRRAKSMLMAGCPVSDVLFSLYARRHLGKSQGRKMKVRGIANIHPRQLFMNIKEQLWMVAGSHHFYSLSQSMGTHCN